jgi:Tol biopolymer transport system component
MPLAVGARFGPYEILAPIGAGGMGEVYRARDTRLGRDVAVKVLPAEVADDVDRRARFEHEARAAATLSHPNILALYDVGRENGISFLVTELLEGRTLRELMEDERLTPPRATGLAAQMVDGLAAAHLAGIVHRDFKPENVFVTSSGHVKILDFGLAQTAPIGDLTGATATAARPLTAPLTVLGTVGYMSPEQVRGQKVDYRADIFAFGAVLYEMVSGRRAFTGTTSIDTMSAITRDPPAPVDTAADRPLSPALVRIVDRCLEKSPAARFQSTTDLAFALRSLSESDSKADSTFGAPARGRSRLKPLVWGLIAVLMLAAGTAIGRWRGASTAESRLVKLSIAPPEGAAFDTMAVSPDGRLLAFTAADASGTIRLWVRALDSLTGHALPATDGAGFPFWSPDSRYVAFSAGGQLRKIPVAGGPPQVICEHEGTRGSTWGRDGVIVFTPDSSAPLLRVSENGGEVAPVTSLDDTPGVASHRWPWFLPDGRHYLFTMRGGPADITGIYVGSLDSPARTRLSGDLSNAAFATSSSGEGYLLFVRGRSLLAQPFDVDRLRVTGEPWVVDDNVWYSSAWALGAYSVSQSGVLVIDSVSRGRDVQIAWFDRTGTRGQTLGEFSSQKFSISPDGTRVALDSMDPQTGTMKLWTLDLLRGVTTRFSPGSTGPEGSPAWSPDGARIVFFYQGAIFERSSNGIGDDTLVLKTDGQIRIQDWSKDGGFLLYRRRFDAQNKGDLWALPMSAGANRTPFPVAKTQFDEGDAAFSPDGKWVAYDSSESGRREVYVQAFSTSGSAGKWQVSNAGGLHPQWRGDGKELFYLSTDLSMMMSVGVTPGVSFQAGTPKRLFGSRFDTGIVAQFAVTPDGQKFLISVPMAQSSAVPTIILNWTAALKSTNP